MDRLIRPSKVLSDGHASRLPARVHHALVESLARDDMAYHERPRPFGLGLVSVSHGQNFRAPP